uniref:WW domain-binding protein 4 n=1 Tax=Dendroctonus ponderosae TaxID=77166 RepID=J3JZI2_DENPD|nr:unknown [Dendroctonus ponderosae]
MADYWKSQDRKYCDFCKCWIADNKPSRDFHENGKRHKENVKKRLKTITKDSAKAFKASEKVDAAIKAMEVAALDAYRRDVEHNATVDLTSMAIRKQIEDEKLEIVKVWHEAVTKDGKSYFWNTNTNETAWEAPSEGYLSLLQQKAQQNRATAKQFREVESYNRKEALLRAQQERQEAAEESARAAREELKKRRVAEEPPPPVYGPILEPGKNDPYGKWHTVQPAAPVVDWQLPQQPHFEGPVVEAEPEPQVKEFREKTLDRLEEGVGESGGFKRRKIQGGPKRNMRQRLEDD